MLCRPTVLWQIWSESAPLEPDHPDGETSVFTWCTDEVEPQNRFDYWREVRAKGLFGVTAELEREQRGDFFGEFSLRNIGGAGLVELRASPYKVERSAADIADAPSDSI